MSYKVGQLRKAISTSYLTKLTWAASSVKTSGYASKIFDDYAIVLDDEDGFVPNKTYYLRFSIKRIKSDDPRFADYPMTKDTNDPRELSIKLELFKNDGVENNGEYELGTYQVLENNVAIEPYLIEENSEYASYEIIFTPNDTYKYLGFVLSRTPYDYLGSIPRDDVRSNIKFEDAGELCVVNNILPITPLNQIGIQARPGTLLCINREAVRVGKSGIYEVNNGVPVTFLCVAAPGGYDSSKIDNFIIDYSYND